MVKVSAGTAWAVLIALVFHHPVRAQQRVFVLSSQPAATTTVPWEGRLEAGRIASVTLWPATSGIPVAGPVLTAGGQLVVWRTRIGADYLLAVFDRAMGTTHLLPDIETLGVSDPARPRLFVPGKGVINVLSAAGVRPLANTTGLVPAAISRDGARLYAIRGQFGSTSLLALDSTTGDELWSLPLGATTVQVELAADEASVWVQQTTLGPNQLRRIAIPSGAELVSFPANPLGFEGPLLGVDTGRHRAFMGVHTGYSPAHQDGLVLTFDTRTGTEVGRVEVEYASTGLIDAENDSVLVHSSYQYPCPASTIRTLSATTGVMRTELPLPAGWCHQVAFALPPPAPTLDMPVISPARSVMLSWRRAPELTTGFIVEAGSAPGLADLALLPVANGTALRVPNVLPGTYYVRVKALNYIGASLPSNEVAVVVP